ncbi:MAG: hypothetical protein AAF518_05410 [Spirochaetota bacterium]
MKFLLDEKSLLLSSLLLGFLFLAFRFLIYFNLPNIEPQQLNAGISSPLLNLELAESPQQIYTILGGPEEEGHYQKITSFRTSLSFSNYYICIYFLYFCGLFELTFRKSQLQIIWKFLFYLTLSATTLCHFAGNYKLDQILQSKSILSMQESFSFLKELSLCKHLLFFFISGVVGMFFWLVEKGYTIKVAGIFLFTSFTLALVGLYKFYLLELAFYFLYLGVACIVIYTTIRFYSNFRKYM